MKYLLQLLAVTFLISSPLFAKAVATITALKGDVRIHSTSVDIAATLGAKLEQNDSVITKEKSKAQIIFEDETIVTIGKNSNFSIKSYIFNNKESNVELNLIQGAMRTITGKIGKIAPSKFKVRTKTATIGIRGTNFTIVAREDGGQNVYCTYGAISVTYNKTTHIVKQGFYVRMTPSGKSEVKKFTAADLKVMQEQNFEAGKEKKVSIGDEDALVVYEDNVVESEETESESVTRDVSDDVNDAVSTAPTAQTISMYGYSIDLDGITAVNGEAVLVFQEDGSSFDTAASYVEVIDKYNATGTKDDWYFYLKETPDVFLAKDDFKTAFGSVSLVPQIESSAKNPQLLSSSFTTLEDLKADDYMSWGEWEATASYEYSDFYGAQTGSTSSTYSDTKDFKGLWVSGQVTDSTVIAARDTTALYSGEYRAFDADAASFNTIESGSITMNVDFAQDIVNVTILQNNAQLVTQDHTFEGMQIKGNGFAGTAGSSDVMYGNFYGPNAEAAGGNFKIDDNAKTLKGVFQAVEQQQ